MQNLIYLDINIAKGPNEYNWCEWFIYCIVSSCTIFPFSVTFVHCLQFLWLTMKSSYCYNELCYTHMAIFSDRDLSFSEVCEDLSWSAPGPRITKWCARNFTLVSSRAPCVAGRLGRARGVWLFVEVRMLLVLSTIPSHAVRPRNWHQLLHISAN